MLEEIAVSKFKATCLRLLGNVKKTGNSFIITKKGEPIAIVSPPPPSAKEKSWIGSMKDAIQVTGDIVSPAADDDEWEVIKD
jgi:antitoxin (DNA-binding transcriptional repressor) of toxin-antitoxin stability system